MKITVEKAALSHLEEIGRLYDTLCDQLRSGRNYPGWQSGRRQSGLRGLRPDKKML